MDRPSVCARAPRSPRRPTAKAPCAMTAAKFAQWLLRPRNILIYSHMRNASFMEPAILFHHAIHCPPADVNAVLLKRKADAIHAVVSVIRMLFENLFDLSRKKLTAAVPAPVSKPLVITGLAQVQNTAHLLCRVDALAFGCEQVPLTRFYFLRSCAKKPSASLRILFAVRSPALSRSSSRMRIVCSSALGVFAGGAFRRMLR